MPQNSTLNQNIWASLEGKVRGWGGLQYLRYALCGDGSRFQEHEDHRQCQRTDRRAVALLESAAAPAGQPEPADLSTRGG
ncbi:MAG: hypothetical protein ACLVJK_08990 [Alistipes putredinis]